MEARPPAWQQLADVLLQREAALCRIVAGVPPRDFAGLYTDADDVERALRALPGLDAPPPDTAGAVAGTFTAALGRARQRFAGWLAGDEDGGDEPGGAVLQGLARTAGRAGACGRWPAGLAVRGPDKSSKVGGRPPIGPGLT